MDETDEPSASSSGTATSRSKVARLIREFELDDVGDELAELWTRERDERLGLRELADRFNVRLLARALRRNGVSVLDGEAENYYRLLTDEDVSSGMRVQLENRLERDGVDVAALRRSFVSRQAIHTYLTAERGISYDDHVDASAGGVDARIDTVRRLKSRMGAVAERAVADLTDAGDESHVSVVVRVQCGSCGGSYPVSEFLRQGGCDCGGPGG